MPRLVAHAQTRAPRAPPTDSAGASCAGAAPPWQSSRVAFTRRLAPCLCALFLVAVCGGCTAIILSDAAKTDGAPCESAGDCAAGSRCRDGTCDDVADEGDPPPAPGTVGDEGGTLIGPDDISVTIPAHALNTTVTFTVSRGSSTTVARTDDGEVVPHSRFYTIDPPLDLALAATVEVPLDDSCPQCTVFHKASFRWVPLAETVVTGDDRVSGVTTSLGEFVAGREQQ
jgi:hypothetical protein